MNTPLQPGFYWVKQYADGDWEIARHHSGNWRMYGHFLKQPPEVIHPTPIEPPKDTEHESE